MAAPINECIFTCTYINTHTHTQSMHAFAVKVSGGMIIRSELLDLPFSTLVNVNRRMAMMCDRKKRNRQLASLMFALNLRVNRHVHDIVLERLHCDDYVALGL